jgi:D-arabinose 1-dehydrogenase-like Zn-dependent alcohol dehydrogenase
LKDLASSFAEEAASKGIDFICLNPVNKAQYEAGMKVFKEVGFDDIIILAPVPAVISDASTYLAPKGVMNIFAGVPRGKTAAVNFTPIYTAGSRVIGHTASTIENMRFMLELAETDQLSPNRSVAAIGSLDASRDGLKAVADTLYPGKIVIYPHIKHLPLTAITDLKDVLPTVYAKMKNGREWTTEAESELLRVMLK